jgi:hypothetical protein
LRLLALALLASVLHAAVGSDPCTTAALLPAYAHNDYRNQRPLLDALDLGYRGAEADVFRVGTELRVGHERSELRPSHTLTRLYLEPLGERQRVCGYVLADRSSFFLNIELKDVDSTAFSNLVVELSKYEELFRPPAPGAAAPVRVTLVGWWPPSGEPAWPDYLGRQLVVERGRNTTGPTDGRPIGLVSIDYGNVFRWGGHGDVPAVDREQLAAARALATTLAVPLRVHHVPVDRRVYRWLLSEGVTLLGTTDLPRTSSLLRTGQ